MKNRNIISTLVLAALFSFSKANATTVIIQAIGTTSATEEFSPAVANAVCGDTIRWVLVSGTHTTASTSIPPGAMPWSSANITVSGFIYVVTVAGTYDYTCHPATGGHMDASIVVTCATGIPTLSANNASSVYPNPSNGKLMIEMKNATNGLLEIYTIAGEKIFESQLTNPTSELNLSLSDGTYFYTLKSEQVIIGKGNLVIRK